MWAAINFIYYPLRAWQSGHSAVEKSFYLITYTVANHCGFWHCQGVILLPEIASSVCGGTGCSCGCSAKPLWLHPTPRNAQTPAQRLDCCFIRVGSHGLPPTHLLQPGKEHCLSSASWVTTCQNSTALALFGCVAITSLLMHPQILYSLCWVGFKISPIPGLMLCLQRECARAVMGQWWCYAGLKEKTVLCDKKKSQRGELLKL